MKKYLYLTKREWRHAWINGGNIPIALASNYLSVTREATQTPDENLIHESPVDIKSLSSYGIHLERGKNINFTNCTYNGAPMPNISNANYYKEDGLILSFCNRKSKEICHRLGKEACVVIHDIYSLKQIIDLQLGVESIANECQYTDDHQRNHFLKGMEDRWQDEFRLFWPTTVPRWVKIPSGIASSIKIK